jgi:transcriptional regulator with XRE-family HTH domain
MERQLKSRIAFLRQQKGWTQLKLSREAGVTENTVQNWEKGRAGLEQIERVLGFCKALNCQVEDLIDIETKAETSSAGADKSVQTSNFLKSNIAKLRDKAKLTQRKLASEAGVTENTVQNWEHGRLGIVQIERVLGFCQALNCKVEDLIKEVKNLPVDESKSDTASPVAETNLSSSKETEITKPVKIAVSHHKKASKTAS